MKHSRPHRRRMSRNSFLQGKRSRRRRRPVPEKGAVRLPKDYPWVVASHLLDDLAEYMPVAMSEILRSVIRSRNIDDMMSLARDWSLQCMASESEVSSGYDTQLKLLFGALLKKFPFEGNCQVRKSAAIKNFLDGEETCSAFNKRGYKILFDSDSGMPSRVLSLATDFVCRVLGPLDEESVMRWCRHGPGSSTSTSHGRNSSYYKYGEWPYHVTADAASHAKRLILSDERWIGALEDSYREAYSIPKYCILNQEEFWNRVLNIVPGNRITTVPKDYHKDRPIAIEPTLNLMLQLGVDGYIRRRLRRWGVNLNSQWKNQVLAREGSVSLSADAPCTIDLSNASDSVSLRLCKLLFPGDWYEYVTAIRSPKGELPDGRQLRYSKLSSMGNGATFAIESLIFTAICYAASMIVYGFYYRDKIVVYGDDIVVPESMALITVHTLQHFGFSINREKSFLKGPVKESCGTDWIRGRMVRPVYLKEYPEDICGLFAHRNLLYRWCITRLGADIPRTTKLFLKWIPEAYHLWGPISDEEFSGYLHTSEPGVFKRQAFRYRSAAKLPIPQEGNEFLFRKLMHQLKVYPQPGYEDLTKSKLSQVSSAFVVTARGRYRLSVVKRVDPVWNDSYQAPGAAYDCETQL